MNLLTVAIQEEEELQAGAGARAGLMKKSAGALSVDDISSDVIIQQEATDEVISRELQLAVGILSWRLQKDVACYLEIAIAKRCRLHKLIRQRFALALKIQQEDFALIIHLSQDEVSDASNSSIQSRATVSSRRNSRRKESKK
ncbi:disease resistance protein [Dorcoceras hygrometricum]|uniref:Disease resistance protein n=1 Tax=Dorcoceras hygrometricum TaxID=472368 RepID=A0A2Z7AW47_9LAMI|nr:disease resistance protein [Dorcoceras hygrometricum]